MIKSDQDKRSVAYRVQNATEPCLLWLKLQNFQNCVIDVKRGVGPQRVLEISNQKTVASDEQQEGAVHPHTQWEL